MPASAMDITKMGNIVATEGIETHISGILGQCATITPHRLPDVTTIHTPTSLCSSLSQRSVHTTAILLYLVGNLLKRKRNLMLNMLI